MKKYFIRFFLGILFIYISTICFGLEVSLKYEKYTQETQKFRPVGRLFAEKLTECPKGNWKLPQLKSALPIYSTVKLGNIQRLVIIDREKAEDNFYNLVYFDSNANNDLTDDPPIMGKIEAQAENFINLTFPNIDTKVEISGKLLPYNITPYMYGYGLNLKSGITKDNIKQNIYIYFMLGCCYSGQFEIAGQKYLVSLADSNVNGYFDERLSLPAELPSFSPSTVLYPSGDNLYITTNQEIGYYDGETLSDKIFLAGDLYDLEINIPESKMTLTPLKENLVALKLPMGTDRLTIYCEDTKKSIMSYHSEKEIKVPKGKYRLIGYQLLQKDQKGDEWRLEASATKDAILANADGTPDSQLIFGEPFIPKVTVPDWAMQNFKAGGNSIQLALNIEGACREQVSDLAHQSGNLTDIPLSTRNKMRPKEATFKIMKPDGTIVHQGTFEYG